MLRKIENFAKSKTLEYAILIAIVFIGVFVRLWKINNPIADWHSWRQVDTASVSKIYVQHGIDLLKPKYYDISRIQTGTINYEGLRMVEFPVYNYLQAILEKNFHLKDIYLPNFDFKNALKERKFIVSEPIDSLVIWGRLLSILSAVITAAFLFHIANRFLGKGGGVLAAFFYLFVPYNIYFTRVILPEPMAVMFAVASLWFFVKYIDSESKVALILSAILFALSTLVKPFTFFYAPAILFLAFEKHGIKWIYKNVWLYVFAALAITPFFAWRIWINKFPQGIPHFAWAFNGDNIRFRPAFWRWLFGERLGRLILGMWGLVPFGLGVLNTQRKKLFLHFLLLGTVIYLSVIATANVRHDYYQIYLIPPVALMLASGTLYLWKAQNLNKLMARALAIFSIAMMLGMGAYQVKDYYQINHPEIVEAGKAVEKLTPQDAWVIAPYNGDTAFLYHTGRFGWPVVDEPIERMVAKGADYFVSVNFDNDTNYVMKKWKVIEKNEKYVIVDLTKEVK